MVTQSFCARDNESLQSLNACLAELQTQTVLRALDSAFAIFVYQGLEKTTDHQRQQISMLAAYLSVSLGEQHSCIELLSFKQPFAPVFIFDEPNLLLTYLQQCAVVDALALPFSEAKLQCNKPLVLDGSRLYLQRYWYYEGELASCILAKASQQKNVDDASAMRLLSELFLPDKTQIDGELDWQKIAVCIAAKQMISFITGGPGTGKTTTVTKLLALLQGLAGEKNKELIIKLVAPTGKAAARLTESIASAKQKLPAHLQHALPEHCQTIHRLLGAKPLSPHFKANAQNPLHLDVLVVDEASMVDLPLMSKLFVALPQHAQIILLGDKDQLASVEAGSVLSDICAAGNNDNSATGLELFSPSMQTQLRQWLQMSQNEPQATVAMGAIQDNWVMLQKSHRFSANSGIGQLAQRINQGQQAQSIALLQHATFDDIKWLKPQATLGQAIVDEQLHSIINNVLPRYREYFNAVSQHNLIDAFDCLAKQQVLCAQRSGAWGVKQLNSLIQQELNAQGLINSAQDFYIGRPLILTRNDHSLKLFNGDIGIVMPDPQEPALIKVWFNMADGSIRGFLPNRIPPHDTLYAMTIHKSQGSEFAEVHLCLPLINQQSKGRGLSRELLYTGLTRAKQQFTLYAQEKALKICLGQQCIRGSGLAQRLKEGG